MAIHRIIIEIDELLLNNFKFALKVEGSPIVLAQGVQQALRNDPKFREIVMNALFNLAAGNAPAKVEITKKDLA